jgi:hypothetical protein
MSENNNFNLNTSNHTNSPSGSEKTDKSNGGNSIYQSIIFYFINNQ